MSQEINLDKLTEMVRNTAAAQSTPFYRENYLRSCESKGGDLAKIAGEVRKEFPVDYCI